MGADVGADVGASVGAGPVAKNAFTVASLVLVHSQTASEPAHGPSVFQRTKCVVAYFWASIHRAEPLGTHAVAGGYPPPLQYTIVPDGK